MGISLIRALQQYVDTEYDMKEKDEIRELAGKNELICANYRETYSEGIHLTNQLTRIKLHCKADPDFVSEMAGKARKLVEDRFECHKVWDLYVEKYRSFLE